jgi:putative transposase
MAKLSAKESDRRKDWIEKTTTNLLRNYDMIALEALKIKNMTKSVKGTKDNPGKNVRAKSGLNRSVLEQGWGIFGQRLTDKATSATTAVEVIAINPTYTNLRCHECGYADKKNRSEPSSLLLSIRITRT